MMLTNILEAIGKTPIVPMQKIGKDFACEIYAKCEFLNPGGSIKDRIAARMVAVAEQNGQIKPGDTLIEPTSGNTGIGIAMVGAVKGYKVIITMPEKMSREKQVILEALGATIYRTPTAVAWDHPDSHISLAKKLQKEIPHSFILDQYSNPANPQVHYETTAQEILNDMPTVDMVVMSVGTGGTITGVAKHLKKVLPRVQIIGVDPYGSILGGGTDVFPYYVEGIGYDFFPKVLDNSLVDEYVKVGDKDAFLMARRIIKEEGLLVGGSCGATMWAALQVANRLSQGQKCLVILPDGIRNYLSKFPDDDWMREHGFLD
jgi:cysteine synthase